MVALFWSYSLCNEYLSINEANKRLRQPFHEAFNKKLKYYFCLTKEQYMFWISWFQNILQKGFHAQAFPFK